MPEGVGFVEPAGSGHDFEGFARVQAIRVEMGIDGENTPQACLFGGDQKSGIRVVARKVAKSFHKGTGAKGFHFF